MIKRQEISSSLLGETLARKKLMQTIDFSDQIRITPNLNVLKIGGHGIIDYGKKIVSPLVEEIGQLSKKYQLLIITGGGARVRHVLDIGINLGMPTGVLAELAGKISEQNAIMISILLSKYNGTRIHTDDLLELPSLLALGLLPVIHGSPPYKLYEQPPRIGSIPPHRTDTGALLIAEVLGAKSCILIKNVDGLYMEPPQVNPQAELIKNITADELIKLDMEDMVLERKAVELLIDTKNVNEINIINGHIQGNVTKALHGEQIGTIIRK